MLAQGHVQRSLRHTGSITHLAYEQIVAHKQTLLQRTGWNGIVLEEIDVHKIDGHQRKDNGIHPTHYGTHQRIFGILPPRPGNEAGYIRIKDKGYYNNSPPTANPPKEYQIKQDGNDGFGPVQRRSFYFLFLHQSLFRYVFLFLLSDSLKFQHIVHAEQPLVAGCIFGRQNGSQSESSAAVRIVRNGDAVKIAVP